MGQTAIGRPRLTPRFEDTSPVFDSDKTFVQSVVRRGKRGINTLLDYMYGSTPEEEAETAITSFMNPLATMTMGSVLRNPAYRTQMLRKLGEQIQNLKSVDSRNMLLRLLETHPRAMSAFQHAGGTVGADPKYTRGVLRRLEKTGKKPRLVGQYSSAWPRRDVPGLSNPVGNPRIDLTDESIVAAGFPSYSDPKSAHFARRRDLPLRTVAHEVGHFAQHLGPGGKRILANQQERIRLLEQSNILALKLQKQKDDIGLRESGEGLWTHLDLKERASLIAKIKKLRRQASSLQRRQTAALEKGAERTEKIEFERYRDWIKSKGKMEPKGKKKRPRRRKPTQPAPPEIEQPVDSPGSWIDQFGQEWDIRRGPMPYATKSKFGGGW